MKQTTKNDSMLVKVILHSSVTFFQFTLQENCLAERSCQFEMMSSVPWKEMIRIEYDILLMIKF